MAVFKKSLAIVFIFVLVGGVGIMAMSSSPRVENRSGYQTLQGRIYEEGTGTISMLIFTAETGEKYQILGEEDKLRNLKELPLLLTGYVEKSEGEEFVGQLEVKLYNTDYELTEEEKEVAVYGKLEKGVDNLVLLTPKQVVIDLAPESYHGLADYAGQEVVIRGQLRKEDNYHARMEVKSYRIIDSKQ